MLQTWEHTVFIAFMLQRKYYIRHKSTYEIIKNMIKYYKYGKKICFSLSCHKENITSIHKP